MAKVSTRKWTHKGEEKRAYIVRYVDEKGVRRQSTFEKKKDADRFRQKIEAELVDGVHVATSEAATVQECCRSFLDAAERRRDAGKIGRSRYGIYETAIRLHIVPHLGARRMRDLTWADLEDWSDKLGALSPRSRHAYLFVFKMVEDHAMKRGALKKPIVRGFSAETGSAKVKPIRTFSAVDATALLRTAMERPKGMVRRVQEMTLCFVHLAAFCGLRYGEITGLTEASVDFAARVIRVRHSLTAWDELKGPKTSAGLRDVPMPLHIADMLREWTRANPVADPRGLLFRSVSGQPVGQGNFKTHYWYPLLRRSGLWRADGDQLHFHALRHFAASWMIENGLSLPDVAGLMGHAKFDMTLQIYAHPIVGGHRRHEAFERMSGALMGSVQALSGPQILTQ